MPPNPPSTWAVNLSGERFDLEDLPELLRQDPLLTVEKVVRNGREIYRLRSGRLDGIVDGWEALRVGEELVALLNGAMTLQRSSHSPVRAEGPTPILTNGTEGVSVLVPTAVLRFKADRAQDPANGESAETVARSLDLASRDPAVAELLRFLADGTWFGLYKAVETMGLCTRGGRHRVRVITRTTQSELDRFEQTAHWFHRHAGAVRGDPPPQNPMGLPDARRYVRGLVGQWIDHIAGAAGRHDRNGRYR